MNKQTNLTQDDVKQVLADFYEVRLADVMLVIHSGYDGPPTDCQAPSVTATITHGQGVNEERERMIFMLMEVNDLRRERAERLVDEYLTSKRAAASTASSSMSYVGRSLMDPNRRG
jgi:hypothetical protein